MLVAIGIGGSYLGARAGLEFVKGPFGNQLHEKGVEVYFAGSNISSSYVQNIFDIKGTLLAYVDGGAPNLVVTLDELSDYTFGELIYFFWKSLAVSGYMIGVNPFDQPGVEAYKKNMFALLGKPGYEDAKSALEARLAK